MGNSSLPCVTGREVVSVIDTSHMSNKGIGVNNESMVIGVFYDSYSDVMYAMYEDVAVGGIVIFDDVMKNDTG